MDNKNLSQKIAEYAVYLQSEERSKNTIAKYARDLRAFLIFIGGGEITKTMVLDWKDKLIQEYAPTSVNSMLLLHRKRPVTAGRSAGTQQHYHHLNLYDGNWQGTLAAIRTYGACFSKKIMTT